MEKVSLQLRMSAEERVLLKKDAHRHEMTVSEYLRMLIKKQREEDKKKQD